MLRRSIPVWQRSSSDWCLYMVSGEKIQYYYLLDIRVDVPYFTIPAGVLSLPSFWIAASIHNNIERQQFLPLLILLMLATAALVLTGSRLGMVFAKRDPKVIQHNSIRQSTMEF